MKYNESLSIEGYNPDYKNPQYILMRDKDTKELIPWQVDAFNRIKKYPFSLAVAFCGSGKSILQIALAIHDVSTSGFTQKQLIVVPQSHIHKSFVGDNGVDYIRIKLEGWEWEWVIKDNFCDDENKEILRRLKKWLLSDASDLTAGCSDRVITGINAIASHQALGLVWKGLTSQEKKQALKNTTLRLDEFHHVKGVYSNDDDEFTEEEKVVLEQESTALGTICRYAFNHGENTKVCGTTATPFRGDRSVILSKAVRNKFYVYELEWVEHWKTLGIENFRVEYEEYDTDPIDLVMEKIKMEPDEKHFVVVPSTTHKWRPNGKTEMDKFFSRLYEIVPKERVLDLVTQSTQKKNKKLLLQEPKVNDGTSKYDVVVTCMLGREGTDWVPCSRVHNTSHENSVTLALQTMGRPFRRYDGKEHIGIYYYVPRFMSPKKSMSKRDVIADRTNALVVCMQICDTMHPIIMPKVLSASKRDGESVCADNGRPSLENFFGSQYQDVRETLFHRIECLEEKTVENIDLQIADTLFIHKIDVPEDQNEAVIDGMRALVLRALSPKLRNMGVDISFIRENGFDKIIESNRLRDKSIFFEGEYDVKDFVCVRKLLRSSFDEQYPRRYRLAMKIQKEKELSNG